MLIYLDSSVFIKKYFKEIGSDHIIEIWNDAEYLAISQVGYSEILGAIHKKQKMDRFSDKIKNQISKNFKDDWESMIKVSADQKLNSELSRLHDKHLLRGFDAIHLATAILLAKKIEKDIQFLTADSNLQSAAQKEKLDIGNFLWK
jgi:predicted nucleic acid-binding protein